MKLNSLIFSAVVSLVLVCSAHAQDAIQPSEKPSRPSRLYSGVNWGTAISTESATLGMDNFVFGGRFGVAALQAPFLHLSFGLATQFLGDKAIVSGVTTKAWASMIMAESLLRRAFATGLYFGARVGVTALSSKVSSSTTSDRSSTATYVVGPVMGYEFQILPAVSIALDTSWLTVGPATLKFDSTSVKFDSKSALLIQGGVNFHF